MDQIEIKSVCVYCGSSAGRDASFQAAARLLGKELADRNMTLVYGGASVGLMGILADSVLQNGGHVIGVIPQSLVDFEVAHSSLTELRVTTSMHERKSIMAELADAFIAMPGGVGTLEEIFEIWTWAQLRLLRKPFGFLNVSGYFDRLLEFLDDSVSQQFIRPHHRQLAVSSDSPHTILTKLALSVSNDKTSHDATSKWDSVE